MDWCAKCPPAPKRRCSNTWDATSLLSTKQMLLDLEGATELAPRDTPLHIFQLPRELRDLIYDILWQDTIFAFRQDNIVVVARYKNENIDQPPPGVPEWLKICNQMRSESIERFYATAQVSVGEIDRLPAYGHRHFSTASMVWESVISDYVDVHWSRDTRPFSVFSIKEVRSNLLLLKYAKHVKLSALGIVWSVHSQDRDRCQSSFQEHCWSNCCQVVLEVAIIPPEELDFSKFLSLLDTGESGVRRLEISIKPGFPWSKNIPEDILYDWSYLDKLPNCPRAVTLEAYDADWYPAAAMAEVRRKCEDINSLHLRT